MGFEQLIESLLQPEKITPAALAGTLSAIIAFLALLFTLLSKRREASRADISEFYDLTSEISELRIKKENLSEDLKSEKDSVRYLRNVSIINDRLDLLLSRANVLLKKKIRPTDVSLKIIGGLLLELGRAKEATEKLEYCLKLSSSDEKRAVNRRSYGRSLILSGNHELGRSEMMKAAEEFETLGCNDAYDRRSMLYRSIEVKQSLIDAQIRADKRKYVKEDLEDLKGAISRVDELSKYDYFNNSVENLKKQIERTWDNFNL